MAAKIMSLAALIAMGSAGELEFAFNRQPLICSQSDGSPVIRFDNAALAALKSLV